MYELVCPSCGVKRPSPFVRFGAVTRCDSCGYTYRIDRAHVTRAPPPGKPPPPPGPAPLIADPPPPEDPSAGSSITGLSGLSELMQAEPSHSPSMAGDGSTASAAPAPLAAGATPSAAEDLRRGLAEVPEVNARGSTRSATLHSRAVILNRKRRARRTWFVLIASLAVLVGLLGVGLLVLYSVSGDPGRTTPANPAATPATADTTPAAPPDNAEAAATPAPNDTTPGDPRPPR